MRVASSPACPRIIFKHVIPSRPKRSWRLEENRCSNPTLLFSYSTFSRRSRRNFHRRDAAAESPLRPLRPGVPVPGAPVAAPQEDSQLDGWEGRVPLLPLL
ncbi:unnamed protein product [Ixodes pacificus]